MGGSGGFHFLSDDIHDHNARHEASEVRKWDQRRRLQAERTGLRMIDHDSTVRRLEGMLAKNNTYDINGRVYAAGKAPTAPPTQPKSAHWLCQVSGLTSQYNIINNTPLHAAIDDHRNAELERLKGAAKGTPSAGFVQPTRPVACYEMPGFVPIKQRQLHAATERHHCLFS